MDTRRPFGMSVVVKKNRAFYGIVVHEVAPSMFYIYNNDIVNVIKLQTVWWLWTDASNQDTSYWRSMGFLWMNMTPQKKPSMFSRMQSDKPLKIGGN